MAEITNSSNEYFTPENPNIPTYAWRYLKQVANTGNETKDYILLFPETISENVIYKNSKKNLRTVAQALNYILSIDFDKTIDEQIPKFSESESLIELFNGDSLSEILGKLAKAVKEIKELKQILGTSDISKIGDGTLKGAIFQLNEEFTSNYGEIIQALDIVNRTVV